MPEGGQTTLRLVALSNPTETSPQHSFKPTYGGVTDDDHKLVSARAAWRCRGRPRIPARNWRPQPAACLGGGARHTNGRQLQHAYGLTPARANRHAHGDRERPQRNRGEHRAFGGL